MRQFIQQPPESDRSDSDPEKIRTMLQNSRMSLGIISTTALFIHPSAETARYLSDLVRRRETKKRELLCVMRQEFTLAVTSFAEGFGLSNTELCGTGSSWQAVAASNVVGRNRWQVGKPSFSGFEFQRCEG